MNRNAKCNIANRSAGMVYYTIPELNVKRRFSPGETKVVTVGELEQLSFQPGGKELLYNFLQVSDIKAVEQMVGKKTEPEYLLTPAGVKNLLETGSVDQLKDALEFGPTGVVDLIKDIAVEINLNDLNKVKAIEDMTGFDVMTAIINNQKVKQDEIEQRKAEQIAAAAAVGKAIPEEKNLTGNGRRATPITETEQTSTTSTRRTTPNYKVVKS